MEDNFFKFEHFMYKRHIKKQKITCKTNSSAKPKCENDFLKHDLSLQPLDCTEYLLRQ